MGRARVSLRNGILVEHGVLSYALDPKGPSRADYTFVSHAHLDHVHKPEPKARVLASKETRLLAEVRGFQLGRTTESIEGVKLLDSGHILGARAFYIEDEVLYTGDAAGRDRAFMRRCKTKRAKVLITETTFGTENYIFPPIDTVVKEVNRTIAMLFDKGRPVVLMGYQLGKSQVLASLFSSWSPLFVHEQVARINDVYRECGVALKKGKVVDSSLEGLPQGPFVLLAPMMSSRNKLAQRLKKEHGAVFAAFSGWATDPGYRYSLGAEFAFPISDHCDYAELVRLVEEVSPEVVYTTHGFTEEFASDLRGRGFDAKALNGYQTYLSDY